MHTDKDKQQSVSGNEVKKDNTNNKNQTTMNVTDTKAITETVKTGEFNMIPIIIGLAIIAVGAGGAYIIYKKKNA